MRTKEFRNYPRDRTGPDIFTRRLQQQDVRLRGADCNVSIVHGKNDYIRTFEASMQLEFFNQPKNIKEGCFQCHISSHFTKSEPPISVVGSVEKTNPFYLLWTITILNFAETARVIENQ